MIVDIVIPALNEEDALPSVLAEVNAIRERAGVRHVVVADNGSTDRTAEVARQHGAQVVHEPERGYGAACLKALAWLRRDPPDVVVFLDGDHADDASELPALLEPLVDGRAEMVLGSRVRGAESGALTPQQRVGNAVACAALGLLYGARYTDLGPFRAIRWATLEGLGMRDRNYGWTVEMQIKAAQQGVRHAEVPVRYRARIGTSKVSGTLRGTLGASYKILLLLGRYALVDPDVSRARP
jgi:glycosyltransferase involved in cell wall biosynthesis